MRMGGDIRIGWLKQRRKEKERKEERKKRGDNNLLDRPVVETKERMIGLDLRKSLIL